MPNQTICSKVSGRGPASNLFIVKIDRLQEKLPTQFLQSFSFIVQCSNIYSCTMATHKYDKYFYRILDLLTRGMCK